MINTCFTRSDLVLLFTTLVTFTCPRSEENPALRSAASIGQVCDPHQTNSCVPGAYCRWQDRDAVCVCDPVVSLPLADLSACIRMDRVKGVGLLTETPCNTSLQCQKNVPFSSLCVATNPGNNVTRVCLCNRRTRVSLDRRGCLPVLLRENMPCVTDRDCSGPLACVLVNLDEFSSMKLCRHVPKEIGREMQNSNDYATDMRHVKKHLTADSGSELVAERLERQHVEGVALESDFKKMRRKLTPFIALNKTEVVQKPKVQTEYLTTNELHVVPTNITNRTQQHPVNAVQTLEEGRLKWRQEETWNETNLVAHQRVKRQGNQTGGDDTAADDTSGRENQNKKEGGEKEDDDSSLLIIIGGVTATLTMLFIVVVCLCCRKKRMPVGDPKKAKQNEPPPPVADPQSIMTDTESEVSQSVAGVHGDESVSGGDELTKEVSDNNTVDSLECTGAKENVDGLLITHEMVK